MRVATLERRMFELDRPLKPRRPRKRATRPALASMGDATKVLVETAAYTGVPVTEITGRRRDAATSQARQVVMYLMVTDCGLSTPAVGRLIGRDHTTVVHGIRSVRSRMPSLKSDLEIIRCRVKAGGDRKSTRL